MAEANGAGRSAQERVGNNPPEAPSPSSAEPSDSSEHQTATVPSPPSFPCDVLEAGSPGSAPLEQAIATYLVEQREGKRLPKTLEWHQTSLLDLQRYVWRNVATPQVSDLNQETHLSINAAGHLCDRLFAGRRGIGRLAGAIGCG